MATLKITEVVFFLSCSSYSNKLSWFGTMGTDFIDYIISDQHVIP